MTEVRPRSVTVPSDWRAPCVFDKAALLDLRLDERRRIVPDDVEMAAINEQQLVVRVTHEFVGRVAGSRTSFAVRFRDTMGVPPLTYLTQ